MLRSYGGPGKVAQRAYTDLNVGDHFPEIWSFWRAHINRVAGRFGLTAELEGTVAMLHREIDDLLDEVGYWKELHVEQIEVPKGFALEFGHIQKRTIPFEAAPTLNSMAFVADQELDIVEIDASEVLT